MISLVHSLYPGDGVTFSVFTALVQIAAAVLLTMLLGNMFLRHRPAAEYAAWLTCLALAVVCPLIAMSAHRAGMRLVSFPRAFETTDIAPWPADPHETSPMAATTPRSSTPPRTEFAAASPQGFVGALPGDEPQSFPVGSTQHPIVAKATEPFGFRSAVAMAAAIWAAGALFMVVRLVHGVLSLRDLRRTTTPLDESALLELLARVRKSVGMLHLPPILLSEHIRSPVVAGLRRPVVLLPASLVHRIRRSRLHEVLVHEMRDVCAPGSVGRAASATSRHRLLAAPADPPHEPPTRPMPGRGL